MAIEGLKRLDGKVVVITGGAQGLGQALSMRFAAEGAKVVIGDLNEAGAAETAALIGENAFCNALPRIDRPCRPVLWRQELDGARKTEWREDRIPSVTYPRAHRRYRPGGP